MSQSKSNDNSGNKETTRIIPIALKSAAQMLNTGHKHKNLIVYQMGRQCGGAHEMSGIKAPLFLCGWVGLVSGGVHGVLVRDVVGGGGRVGGGMGNGVLSGW